jgi:hypothetical protein
MIPVLNSKIEKLLVDVENAFLPLSQESWAMNQSSQGVFPRSRNTQTVANMEAGKFRRLFNRHRTAYRFFN